MKSYGKLWHQVCSWNNLLSAYRKCRRRKRYRHVATAFDFSWESNLLVLQRELQTGEYQPGDYRNFEIREPKRRTISAAPFRDRVIHHALINVLEPIFEPRFIHDSYACRKGKGTHAALLRTQKFLRRFPYYFKGDIVKFFPNVDHDVLFTTLQRRIRDIRVLELIGTILDSGKHVLQNERSMTFFPGDDLFSHLRPCGLPIGNLTSQFFANVMLDQMDHFVKEELRLSGYVRYADDFVLFGQSKRELWDARDQLWDKLSQLRLRMHRNKMIVAPSRVGMTYLGFRISPDSRRLSQDGLRRANRNLRRLRWLFKQRLIGSASVRASLLAWKGHVRFGNSEAIRIELLRRARFRRSVAEIQVVRVPYNPFFRYL